MPTLMSGQWLFEQHAFSQALPLPTVIDTSQRKSLTLQAQQTSQFLGLYDPQGQPLQTPVWGYGTGAEVSYPGPTLLAYAGQPVSVHWQNKLPLTGHLLPVDTSLQLAQGMDRPLSKGYVPLVTHLHGGHTRSQYDGLPEQWFTQHAASAGATGPREVGRDFKSADFVYDNDQQAATLWYHDHALGLTRLNVYAGLAGFYILQDEQRLALEKQGVLPSGAQDLGAVIQDRAFTSDGRLYYPAYKGDVLPGQFNEDGSPMTVGDLVPEAFYQAFGQGAASAVPEFFGDTLLVNGMAWPSLNVAAGEMELRLLNGSDSRFYVLRLDNPKVGVTLVGTDGGLLPQARTLMDGDGQASAGEFFVLAPGDRLELVMAFSRLKTGEQVRLLNEGPDYSPFKGVDSSGRLLGDAQAATASDSVGQVMQFKVDGRLKPLDVSVTDGTVLNARFVNLALDANADGLADAASVVRHLGLFEGADSYGRVMPMLGTAEPGRLHSGMDQPDGDFGPLSYAAPVTEKPLLGSTEQWEFFNFTADSHPVHLHLAQFQEVERRQIQFEDRNEDGLPDDTNQDGRISYGQGEADFAQADIWVGERIAARPEETGWQDTLHVNPGEMLSVVATFDKPGEYVWHCHILSHEDNEMMRPFLVEPEPALV